MRGIVGRSVFGRIEGLFVGDLADVVGEAAGTVGVNVVALCKSRAVANFVNLDGRVCVSVIGPRVV